MIAAIPKEDVDRVWPLVERDIESALEHSLGEMSLEDVRRFCKSGEMLLLTIGDPYQAAAVLRVYDCPQKKILHVPFIAGRGMSEWIAELDVVLDRIAREVGAADVSAVGRRGWERALKGWRFQHRYSVLSRSVS